MPTTFLALIIILLWGLNWPAAFIALGSFPPLTFRILTLAFGGGALMLFCMLSRISLRIMKGDFIRLITASLLNVMAWNILSVYAIVQLNSARSAIVAFSMPFWTVMIHWMLGQYPTHVQRVTIAISSAGIAGLVLSASFDPSFSGIGAIVMSCAAFVWACGSVYVKRYPVDMPSTAFTAWVLVLGAAMVALFLPLQHENFLGSSIDWQAWGALFYATFIGIALCQACWFSLLNKLGSVGSSLILLGIPPVGVASSWLLVDATVSLLDVASLGLLLLAASTSFPVIEMQIQRVFGFASGKILPRL